MAEDKSDKGNDVTLNNVHLLSTYELRQELLQRDELKIEEGDTVNYRSLLQMLVQALTREQEQRLQEHCKSIEEAQETEKERLQALREKRKQEAMERSRLRQADPNYFASRVAQATLPIATTVDQNCDKEEEVASHPAEQADIDDGDDDPFRSTSAKFKVFVR